MKTILILSALLFAPIWSRTIDLYYTEDGRTVKVIRGTNINDNFTLAPEGDESWLLLAGQKIGPNGYVPADNKLTLGSLGKSKSPFTVLNEDFLGIGHSRVFERAVAFPDIAYILPNPEPLQPHFLFLNNNTDGELFIASQPSESTGKKLLGNKEVNAFSIIHLKYNIPRSQRGPSTLPIQTGIKALAVAFSENGLRRAMRELERMK